MKNAPYYFKRNVVVRDNYVYQNGRVGVSWAGGDGMDENGDCIEDKYGNLCVGDNTAGLGAVIYNNHVEVAANTTCYSVTGTKPCTGHDTNENRGYNQAGFGSNVTMNTGHIHRQYVCPDEGNYMTVDGEGVLHQCSNNGNGYRGYWYKNDLTGGQTGYMLYYNNQIDDYNVLIDNKVPSGFEIGATFDKGTNPQIKGNVCQGNQPKCVGLTS